MIKYISQGGSMEFNVYNNKGIANEYNFVKLFDKKRVKDLDRNCQELIYSLFNVASGNDYIECWQSKYVEKADIKIRINGDLKGISIKMGENNSIHQENLQGFSQYLLNIGLNEKIVKQLQAYIHGIINNNKVDAQTYKKLKEKEIIAIKNALSDLYIKVSLIIRFVFKGKEFQLYDADAIIHGTPNNFLWATKSEVLRYLIDYPDGKTINVKVGPLFIQCRNRNLHNNRISKKDENYIQVKWYNLRKDLYFITKKRQKTIEFNKNDRK